MKKIIVTGKGGVGKTTIISTLAKLLVDDGYRLLVIDTDPSMNLAMTLGVPYARLVTLADNKPAVREKLGADGHDGGGTADHSHEVDDNGIADIISTYTIMTGDKIRIMVMGPIPHGGAGCICSSIALVKLIIRKIEDQIPYLDFIIVDSQAGSEVLGRGLAADYDYNLVVAEATPKAIDVARHAMKLARDIHVREQLVIANKVEGGNDVAAIVNGLGLDIRNVYPVSYDRMVLEADKQGRMLDDLCPDSPVIRDLRLVKDIIQG